ncbi:MAG: hypothetical protein A3H51_00905 [Candidatus Spechtbacteria bacterium RIFCSPLOWO2_02_FULL_38_8]|uniref:Cell envelope-related transcriptional attenuator domain-containing protein n=1 Tax=Candidatus Spechtbacteria bacterium RIFCSPLOWO2_02_FULL_38_8 TaxID=1802164 RepID=A0A1G2HK38_9BACT|nr:MAG: hypothetical protein A3H51_00905 [Candidatus Spechtbacteria bacterium RIFCSPLOWO2_02_FULL_38_8]
MNFSTKILILSAAGLFTIAGAIWGLNYVKKNYIEKNQFSGSTKQEAMDSLDTIKTLFENKDSLNILLLGISGETYTSGDLTDSIIFASLNFKNNKIDLVSIPRDLWVKSEQGNFQKINELYRVSGGTEKPNAVSAEQIKLKTQEILGQNIQHIAVINLDGIKSMVDLIGGVDTDEGHLNGEQALFYIRDRSRPGSDFDRMKRQQKLIMAIIDTITKQQDTLLANQETVMSLFNLLDENLDMDISFIEIFTLSSKFKNVDTENIGLHTITTNNLLQEEYRDINGQSIYILYPKVGEENYTEINNFVDEIINS